MTLLRPLFEFYFNNSLLQENLIIFFVTNLQQQQLWLFWSIFVEGTFWLITEIFCSKLIVGFLALFASFSATESVGPNFFSEIVAAFGPRKVNLNYIFHVFVVLVSSTNGLNYVLPAAAFAVANVFISLLNKLAIFRKHYFSIYFSPNNASSDVNTVLDGSTYPRQR